MRFPLIACLLALSATPALAQTAAVPPAPGPMPATWSQEPATWSSMPATWSTDPGCGACALRVTFGGNALAIQRNGHTIYRGPAALAVSDDEIAVRLDAGGERNLIRFSRSGGAIRLVSGLPGGSPHRVPPLYACRATAVEAADAAALPAAVLPAAVLPVAARAPIP